jgi:GlpG protein
MFGAAPDLLCQDCRDGVERRTAPTAVGRIVTSFVGRATPVTVTLLAVSAILFFCVHIWYVPPDRHPPKWLWLLAPYGPTGSIATGQAWRLITCTLLHGGWLHVIFNLLWFWALGRATEALRGSLVFALMFVGSAMFSSAAQLYFHAAGIGLSGVLYALAGFLWMRRKVDALAADVMNPNNARMLGAWFVICIVITEWNIGNWAHGGGLAWGLAAGWASLQRVRLPWYAVLGLVTVAAAVVVSTGQRVW